MKNEEHHTAVSIAAIEQLLETGNQAWARREIEDALDAWQRGLELVDRLPEEDRATQAYLSYRLQSQVLRVWLARGLTTKSTGALDELERHAGACAGIYPQLPVLARLWHARVARRQRDMDRAHQLIHESLHMAERLSPGETKLRTLAAVHLEHGIIALEVSENHVAMSALLQARTLYQQLGDGAGEAQSVMSMGRLYVRMSIPEQAIAQYQEADRLFRDAPSDPAIQYTHHLGWGSAFSTAERYLEAIVHYQAALDLARQLGSEPYLARCLGNVANILRRQGELGRALELYEEALELFRHLHDRYGIAIILNNIGEVYLDLERVHQALPALKEARSLGEAINFRLMLPETNYLLSSAYLLLDRPSTAFDYAEKSLHLAEEIGNLSYAGMAYRGLGVAAAALEKQGRLPPVVPPEGPEAYFITSMEVLAGMNQTYERARTLLAWGKYLRESREPTRRAKGESYLERAAEQFDHLQLPVPSVR
jgi:tetratricopeptide (TPR) repeat protein